MMIRGYISVILIVLANMTMASADPPQSTAPTTSLLEVPTAISFSIEGLTIGMTAAEAEVSAPDLDLREAENSRYRTSYWHDPFVIVVVDSDAKIRTIEVTYRTTKGAWRIKPTGVTFESLVKVLSERWGEPKSNAVATEELKNIFGTTAATEMTRAAVWVKGTQTSVLIERRRVSHFSGMYGGGEFPTVTLTIGRDQTPADLAAEQANAAANDAATREKVKF